jgi:broad specificity phosphatase PhoE
VADPAGLTTLVHASLALVRHGESTWVAEGRFQGRRDPPLSALGESQAARVAARLADPGASPALPLPPGPPTAIWHSPLVRALATAAAIGAAQTVPVPLRPLPALAEIAQGAWEGLTLAQVIERYPRELAAWRTAPADNHAPGGESLASLGERAREAVGQVTAALAEAAGDPGPFDPLALTPVIGYEPGGEGRVPPWAVVVAHDGVLRAVMLTLLDLPLERYWSFPFALCAVTVVELRGGLARLRAHNLAGHLDVAVTTQMQ